MVLRRCLSVEFSFLVRLVARLVLCLNVRSRTVSAKCNFRCCMVFFIETEIYQCFFFFYDIHNILKDLKTHSFLILVFFDEKAILFYCI